ncbi:uncharacterized protein LOC131946442 [Physella acuta]|uniref:uncharacterized protein LOC131946442 n=1 Tax=Physella acuta TaxID=109671 RepID=UPI0027DCBC18|nr:uncharacterized protein LOC131946442 [Physella acuta]XP_059163194.1 uncharacterized protein LOC131946442 [Physella acuta]
MAATGGMVLFVSLLLQGALAADWSYDGVRQWKDHYPKCAGEQQSPINIHEGDVVIDKTIPPLLYANYDTVISMVLSNDGHSAYASISGEDAPTISGGGLPGTFKAVQLHFHWSEYSNAGSEHLISGHSYPLEVHIVHHNTKYASFKESVNYTDGVAVLGFMYMISEADNSNYTDLIDKLILVQTPTANPVPLAPASLQSLLPATYQEFYRYTGSLTMPTCNEVVTWTVFVEPIKISEKQIAKFRSLTDDKKTPLTMNYREVQPLNGRVVKSNYDPHVHWTYGEDDEQWKNLYSKCGSISQSPINIEPMNCVPEKIDPMVFNFYESTQSSMTLKNNGHAAEVVITNANIGIQGAGLPDQYMAAQFHFHWGSHDKQGSEHKIDNRSYPMELHIVHYRKSLGSLGAAVSKPEGLAVLGFFFEITLEDNPALKDIIYNLPSVTEAGTTTTIPSFSLNSILPSSRNTFYRYSGSLTTPGCHESVIWTVFTDTIKISAKQLAAFRNLKSSHKDADGHSLNLVDNFRPVQRLNLRTVVRNFNIPVSKPHWTYVGTHGADHWKDEYPICASSSRSKQSPINIKPQDARYIEGLDDLFFKGYVAKHGVTMELTNNGHAVQADITGGQMLVMGGGLVGTYRAAQFHFHWGSDNGRGSEHLIDGMSYPLEAHIVHYSTMYPDLKSAATSNYGLAVLGIMFEVADETQEGYKKIFDRLEEVEEPNSKVSLEGIQLDSLLPENREDFYRYDGSLTTPGCYETVTWTVFKDTVKISEEQLKKLRKVKSNEKDTATNHYLPLVNNYRPVQPINARLIKASFRSLSGAKSLVASLSLVVSVAVLSLLKHAL